MMENADYPDRPTVQIVVNAMTAVRQASDRRLDIRTQRARLRVAAQQVECLLKASQVSLSGCPAELLDTVFEDCGQVGGRGRPQPDISHAAQR